MIGCGVWLRKSSQNQPKIALIGKCHRSFGNIRNLTIELTQKLLFILIIGIICTDNLIMAQWNGISIWQRFSAHKHTYLINIYHIYYLTWQPCLNKFPQNIHTFTLYILYRVVHLHTYVCTELINLWKYPEPKTRMLANKIFTLNC